MKKRAPQITFKSAPPRYIMFVEREDGSWTVFEDEQKTLAAYRPRRGEHTSTHRAYVRRQP